MEAWTVITTTMHVSHHHTLYAYNTSFLFHVDSHLDVDIIQISTQQISSALNYVGMTLDYTSLMDYMNQTVHKDVIFSEINDALQKVQHLRHGKSLGITGSYQRTDILDGVINEFGARWIVGAQDVSLLCQ
jgi:hypothetical protein